MGSNTEFEFRGINHLALVSSDMARTVDFYTNVLGMPLIKTLEIPGGASALLLRLWQRRLAGLLLVPGCTCSGAGYRIGG